MCVFLYVCPMQLFGASALSITNHKNDIYTFQKCLHDCTIELFHACRVSIPERHDPLCKRRWRVDVNAHVTAITYNSSEQHLWAPFFPPSALKIVTAWSRNRRGYHPHMQPSFWGTKTHRDGTLCSLIVSLMIFLVLNSPFRILTYVHIAHKGLPPLANVRKTCRSSGDLECIFGLKCIFLNDPVLFLSTQTLSKSMHRESSFPCCQGITLPAFSEWK